MARRDPLASIVIPTFNHGQYVGQAIRSVLDQTYRHREVVVVDDGSTDDSREVLARFGDRVRYLWQENRGLSAARNAGIRAAQGEYVGLLDADDMYEPEFLSTLVPILEGRPDAAAVYCGYRFVNRQNHPLPQQESRVIPEGQLYQALVDGNFLVPEAMLVRRRCYDEVGPFDETLSACEDLDMWLRIAHRYVVLGTAKLLTRHRILPDSMSSDPNRQTRNRLAVMAKHFGPAREHDSLWTVSQRRAYGHSYLASTVEYLQVHDEARAYECWREAARIYPDLLTQFDVFYQLGCGEQLKGSVGDFTSLNIERSTQVLIALLDQVFSDPETGTHLNGYRRAAYSNAHLALATLSYGARQLQASRRFLRRAVGSDSTLAFDRRVLSIFVKSLVGVRLINRLQRQTRRR